ncbi:hypothetical protein SMGD1_2044 [Sulfurimonas gotlandica GD1]|uniref:VWFA domain-containing protein n=1 Tax=Sulfurimonas gotlandica (strain DSM 19862 / JCM 16533 / GD1) TaxID=929558 RepID=H1FWZ1_SULGG|nr:hypothetical protein [Sulfurimonas gotlandica]EHP30567.1 hypothetical protein SMGD1_2044 [Sulfurimonas gotlandica GD1]
MINIFIDTSGSMTEMGKDSAAIYAVKSIQDYCEFNNLQSTTYTFDGKIVDRITSIRFDKNMNMNILNNFLSNSNLMYNILISDGLFNDEVKLNNLISISIGIDANIDYLEKATLKVFEPENIIAAIEYILFTYNTLSNIEEENDEYEW